MSPFYYSDILIWVPACTKESKGTNKQISNYKFIEIGQNHDK